MNLIYQMIEEYCHLGLMIINSSNNKLYKNQKTFML